ncbi:MAG: 4Fe-4S ferredoxin [Anaerovoracaceae bacterium]
MESFSKVYYSPSGSTKQILDLFEAEFCKADNEYDLLVNPLVSEVEFCSKDCVIVGVPVFFGRVPQECLESLKKLNGNSAKAIPVVVYGNRDYDDALLELENILKERNFRVVAAGAFIARHSIFPDVASGRPDEKDKEIIKDFAIKIDEKIKKKDYVRVDVKGKFPYKDYGRVQMYPKTAKGCTGCSACAEICPVSAIEIVKGIAKTKENECIVCTACIRICPLNLRKFTGVKYAGAAKAFGIKCRPRKEPEVFL